MSTEKSRYTVLVYRDPHEFPFRKRGYATAKKAKKYAATQRRRGLIALVERTDAKRYFGKPPHITERYRHYRKFAPGRCAPGSFQAKRVNAKTTLIVCCPKGHWSRKRRRCKIGTRTQSILKRR